MYVAIIYMSFVLLAPTVCKHTRCKKNKKVSFPTPYCYVCLGGRWDSNPRP